jgi:hypothetical protein
MLVGLNIRTNMGTNLIISKQHLVIGPFRSAIVPIEASYESAGIHNMNHVDGRD